jgi:hypothetical protein
MNLPPEFLRIASLLDPISCSLSINSISESGFTLTSQTDNGQHIFDLKLEHDRQNSIATFFVSTSEKMNIEEYDRIFELLNFLNVCDGQTKFFFNPETSELGCSSVLYVGRGAHFSDLDDRLRSRLATFMSDLTKLIKCITEKVPLREALELTIGDTAEIRRAIS